MKEVLRAKIHRATITGTNLNYLGSIYIDKALMKKVGIIEFEKVLVCDVTNGNRWETYVIEGKENSKKIEVQGAGSKLCKKGDIVIILSFEITDETPRPKIILVDEKNKFVKYL